MSAQWYYLAENEQQLGPVSDLKLRRLAYEGAVKQETLIWREGLSDWKPAGLINALWGEEESESNTPAHATQVQSAHQAYPPQGHVTTAQPYVSAARRVKFLTVLFVITAIWQFLMMCMNLTAVVADVDNWGEVEIGNMLYSSFWIAFTALGVVFVPVYITTVVVFCMWVHRSNTNARALGAEGMEFTPGWCVGWFFIPIMNLFKPYQAVREIYQASDPNRGPRDWKASHAGIVGVWWALWIVSNLVDNAEARLGMADGPGMLTASCWVGVFGGALGIVLCVAVVRVVRSIQSRLDRKAVKQGQSDICAGCGYDLSGNESGQCPECGLAINRSAHFA